MEEDGEFLGSPLLHKPCGQAASWRCQENSVRQDWSLLSVIRWNSFWHIINRNEEQARVFTAVQNFA